MFYVRPAGKNQIQQYYIGKYIIDNRHVGT